MNSEQENKERRFPEEKVPLLLKTPLGSWTEKDTKAFLKAYRSLFDNTPKPSATTICATIRESEIEPLVARIEGQIMENYYSGKPWRTPEDWDIRLKEFGGGLSRRKSMRILSRTSWENFLKLADEVIEKHTKGET